MTDQQTKPMEATAVAAATTGKVVKPKVKKVVRQVPRGNAYIQATYNNTLITITDPNGAVLGWASAGASGFKGPKKATPYAASMVVKNLMNKLMDYGVREVNVFVKGIGGGRESAIRAFHINGLNVLSITDTTPIPHNGCRPPKRRRV
ncbi:MAG TPA: 30S ribosomal protein S11 [Patescibacteria group bacterium]|nr:30S ribosomal protein S11 [Patescibacteria group bacterium]